MIFKVNYAVDEISQYLYIDRNIKLVETLEEGGKKIWHGLFFCTYAGRSRIDNKPIFILSDEDARDQKINQILKK